MDNKTNGKKLKKRWTIVNVESDVKDAIVKFSADNGYTVARAIKELTKRELSKWKNDDQQ